MVFLALMPYTNAASPAFAWLLIVHIPIFHFLTADFFVIEFH